MGFGNGSDSPTYQTIRGGNTLSPPWASNEDQCLQGRLSPGRPRPNCIGCMGGGVQCVECRLDERRAQLKLDAAAARGRQMSKLLPPPMLQPLPTRKDGTFSQDLLDLKSRAAPRLTSRALLRPSRSLPPGGLSCGYTPVEISQYRRALSSLQSLPAYVEGLERHHRRNNVVSNGDDGSSSATRAFLRGLAGGRTGLSTAPPLLPPSDMYCDPRGSLFTDRGRLGLSTAPSPYSQGKFFQAASQLGVPLQPLHHPHAIPITPSRPSTTCISHAPSRPSTTCIPQSIPTVPSRPPTTSAYIAR